MSFTIFKCVKDTETPIGSGTINPTDDTSFPPTKTSFEYKLPEGCYRNEQFLLAAIDSKLKALSANKMSLKKESDSKYADPIGLNTYYYISGSPKSDGITLQIKEERWDIQFNNALADVLGMTTDVIKVYPNKKEKLASFTSKGIPNSKAQMYTKTYSVKTDLSLGYRLCYIYAQEGMIEEELVGGISSNLLKTIVLKQPTDSTYGTIHNEPIPNVTSVKLKKSLSVLKKIHIDMSNELGKSLVFPAELTPMVSLRFFKRK